MSVIPSKPGLSRRCRRISYYFVFPSLSPLRFKLGRSHKSADVIKMKVCAWTFFGIPAAIVAILLAFILMNEHDETWHFHLDYQIGCRNALVQANLKTEPTDFAILDTVKKKPFWSKLTKDEFEQVEKAKADLAQVASK